MLDSVPPDITHCDFSFLGELFNKLDEFPAPLLIERRDGNPNKSPVRYRVEPQVSRQDRFFDGRDHMLIPWLNGNGVYITHAEVRHLIQRYMGTVIFNPDPIKQCGRCLARSYFHKFLTDDFTCFVHLFFGLLEGFFRHAPPSKLFDRIGSERLTLVSEFVSSEAKR